MEAKTGTWTEKKGLAQMLKGGVIMDVVNAEQAKIAEDAVRVRRVAEGEAPLDAAVAAVRAAVLPWHHGDDLVALHPGLEGTAHAAVGAGGQHRVLRLAVLDDAVLHQGGRGAVLHAGPAGHARTMDAVWRGYVRNAASCPSALRTVTNMDIG